MRDGVRFTALSALAAVAVALLAWAWVGEVGRADAWAGAGVAFAAQAALFWLLFAGGSPASRLPAHLMGTLGRLAVFAVAALVWVPRAELAPAPTLFSLVAVFFVTTLMEPLFVVPNSSTRR